MSTRITQVVELAGSPTQIGEGHGEQLRDLIHETAARWRDDVARTTQLTPDELLMHLIDDSGLIRLSYQNCPQLVEEIAGISRASGLDMRTTWALNLMDEDWWIRGEIAQERDERHEHCSSFGIAASEGQPALIGQNMDLPGWLDGLQVLLRIAPDNGPRVLAPSYPGMVATNAFNEHGVGTCQNTLTQLATSREGLPVAIAIRAVASCTSAQEAARFLRSVRHASGQNYLVGADDAVLSLEAGAAGVNEYSPGSRIAHTNHPLAANEDDGAGWAAPPSSGNTFDRWEVLSGRLAQPGQVGPAEAFAFLREPPLCRGRGTDLGSTFYAAVWEIGSRTLHLTAGPPDEHEPVAHTF